MMSINVDAKKKEPEPAADERLRASATAIAKMTGTNFGDDAIGKIMAKYDADGNGKFDLNEVRGIATDVLTQKAGKKAYKGVAIASFFLLILAIAAIFGVTFAAGEMLKDTEAKDSTLATRDGSVLKTSPATHAMPLLVAPVLDLAQLEKMQTMTVSYLDPNHNDTKVKAVLGLTSAMKISDTRVSFAVDSPWVEQVKIWDGYAFVVLPGAVSPCGAPPPCPPARSPARSPPCATLTQAAPRAPCARPTSRARRSRSTTPPIPTRSSRRRPRRSRRRATGRRRPRASGASTRRSATHRAVSGHPTMRAPTFRTSSTMETAGSRLQQTRRGRGARCGLPTATGAR